GQAPTLLLNGKGSDTETPIKNGDHIDIQKGVDGEQAKLTIVELIGEQPATTVFLNQKKYDLKPIYYVNGEQQPHTYMIRDKDEITYKQSYTIREFFERFNLQQYDDLTPFQITVNNKLMPVEK